MKSSYKTNPREYSSWQNMKDRCRNKNNPQYKDYGGRGIGVCLSWQHSFSNFFDDMGPKPEGLTLDRIDNDKGYSPSNCRWTTVLVQNNNQRTRTDGRSKYKGVSWNGQRNTWRARLQWNGVRKNLGCFKTEEDAAEAYNKASAEYQSTIL